jgi:transcriptional regulator with XRE-family HTH domain
MDAMTDVAASQDTFGHMLREYRRTRRLSQLDFSLQADISQRHLSFLESGRARPSREMVLQLAEALDVPLEARNRLLLAAGFAGVFPRRSIDASSMAPVREALSRILAQHEPFPAFAVDRAWNLLLANAATPRLMNVLGGLDGMVARVGGPPNLLKLTLHPEGLRPFIANFDEIAAPLLARTAREALEHPSVDAVLQEVLRYPGLPVRGRHVEWGEPMLPILPTVFRVGETEIRLFTTLTSFGTPLDVTADELRIECLFPADAATEAALRALAAT